MPITMSAPATDAVGKDDLPYSAQDRGAEFGGGERRRSRGGGER
jgi:hypothetical protein